MLKVGITGGIGSGKSVVARVFAVLDIPVLDADAFAKELMSTHPVVKQQLIDAFGQDLFKDDILQRAYLSNIVFNAPEKLKQLNSIVHPAVGKYGMEWADAQSSPYIIKEAALFFESASDRQMDFMIGVSAPYALRLRRAMQRDQATEEAIKKRMAQQMDEVEKMNRCDYIVYNDEQHSIIQQVLDLHKRFLSIAKNY